MAKEHTHHTAMQEIGLQDNRTIQNLGEDKRKRL